MTLAIRSLVAALLWLLLVLPATAQAETALWPTTTTPTNVTANDTNAVELGVKFSSSVAGQVTGLRFYKGSTNTGTHSGRLWTASGTKLAEVTFTNETASGWQEAKFAAPVDVAADTTYVASYHSPNGGYSWDHHYWPYSAAPLSVAENGGVYIYGPAGGFPTSVYNDANYWVTPLFVEAAAEPSPPPPPPPPPPSEGVVPMDARAFVDSQGVNTHLFYSGTVYWDLAKVKQGLTYLGMRHVRDGFGHGDRSDMYPRYADMAASGFRGTMIACRFISGAGDDDSWEHFMAVAKNDQVRPFIEGLEGVNEPDLFDGGTHDGGDWWTDSRACNSEVYAIAKGSRQNEYGAPLNVPIYGPSAGPHHAEKLGDLRGIADGGNIHPYPGQEKPSGPGYYPFWKQADDLRVKNFGGENAPIAATETGYHNALNHTGGHKPVSERASGIYLPRMYLEYARDGIERTFLYELVDLWADDGTKTNEQAHFGLFRHDWTPKPAATAIKNMNGWLDGAEGPRTPLDYSVSNTADPDGAGTQGDVRHHLMQRADGKWWLAVWQNSTVWANNTDVQNASVTARVNLPSSMAVQCYRPRTGGTCGALASSAGFDVGVPDDALLLELTKLE